MISTAAADFGVTDFFDFHHTADDTLDKIDPEQLKQNVAAWAAVQLLRAAELEDLISSEAL